MLMKWGSDCGQLNPRGSQAGDRAGFPDWQSRDIRSYDVRVGGGGESHTPVPNPFREGNDSVRRFKCTARGFRRTTLPDDSESVGRPSAFEDEAWLALGAHEAEAGLLRGPSLTRRPRASSCMSST